MDHLGRPGDALDVLAVIVDANPSDRAALRPSSSAGFAAGDGTDAARRRAAEILERAAGRVGGHRSRDLAPRRAPRDPSERSGARASPRELVRALPRSTRPPACACARDRPRRRRRVAGGRVALGARRADRARRPLASSPGQGVRRGAGSGRYARLARSPRGRHGGGHRAPRRRVPRGVVRRARTPWSRCSNARSRSAPVVELGLRAPQAHLQPGRAVGRAVRALRRGHRARPRRRAARSCSRTPRSPRRTSRPTRRARRGTYEAVYALRPDARVRTALERLYERSGRHQPRADRLARGRPRRPGPQARAGGRTQAHRPHRASLAGGLERPEGGVRRHRARGRRRSEPQ